jgi:DNA-binding Lrp family transcriptional regulator
LTTDVMPILAAVQAEIPLARQPFLSLAQSLDLSENDVLASLRAATNEGFIRRIGGLFEARSLGYASALLAFGGPHWQDIGQVVATHPGVSHCYHRIGHERFQVWATLAVSAQSHLGLEATAHVLARQARADGVLILPVLKRYKLDARFGPAVGALPKRPVPSAPIALTDEMRGIIVALQQDLPLVAEPFDTLAAFAGVDVDRLLGVANSLHGAGVLRRYAAVLDHRQAGAVENVMATWDIPADKADAAGTIVAACPQVSHCFLRKPCNDWPHSFYAMIHGPTAQACQQTMDQLSSDLGHPGHVAMWTESEIKKQRVCYLSDEEAHWEHALQDDKPL